MVKKVKKREWTDAERGIAIGLKKAGKTHKEIFAETGIPRRTMDDIWAKFKRTRLVENKKRTGRPRCTSKKLDRSIKLIACRESTNAKQLWRRLKLDNFFTHYTPHFPPRAKISLCVLPAFFNPFAIPLSASVHSRSLTFLTIFSNLI